MAFMWLVKVQPPALVSTYTYVNPIVAVLAGWVIAGEQVGPAQIGALLLVLAGVLIDAHISNTKYQHVTRSIKLFFLSSAFGFLFLLLSQFAPAATG